MKRLTRPVFHGHRQIIKPGLQAEWELVTEQDYTKQHHKEYTVADLGSGPFADIYYIFTITSTNLSLMLKWE